ncbi:hypothetical protein DNTS_007790 [Danionella cerebrum]|uniref:PLAT domain-containing protein n=1 Tax=Danionella cerebrum TaxID=2873325 RepID=A0A553RFF3_9TELE|nr:hypothetical protein DNTS_007790 [Danionella translucida]
MLIYFSISIVLTTLIFCQDNSKNKEHQKYNYGGRINKTHGGTEYEFVQESMSWNEAQQSCEKQGGDLLSELNDEIKQLLQDKSTEAGPWWVSHALIYKNYINGFESVSYYPYKSDGTEEDHVACNYLIKDPFQLVTTSNCSLSFGSLCTRELAEPLTFSEENKRSRRSLSDELNSIQGATITTTVLMQSAKEILKDLETTTEELSSDDRIKFLQMIYDNLKATTPKDGTQYDEIVNSTAAMLLYSQECEPDNMENLEQLIRLAGLIYEKALVSQENIVKELPTGTIYVNRHNSSTIGKQTIGSSDGGYCQLPSLTAMKDQLPSGNVNVQLFQFKENPLVTKSNESITGSVCSFSLSTVNSSLKFSNLPENIEIFLPRPDASEPSVVAITWKKGYSVTSTFNITDVNVTVIVAAIPNQNLSLTFTLYPANEQSNSTWSKNTTVTYKDGYRWLISPEIRKDIEGTWKVSVLPNDFTSSQELTFKVSVFVTKCFFWDPDLEEWSREGCMVGPKSMPNLTHCLCNHTTFFGSSFFVMPNQVDLSQTAALFSTVKENYIVVVLLSCFFGLYLMVVMWAWYADRKALRTRKMTLLEGNHPCAHYNYLVNVQTGHRRGAGTTAKVTVNLQFSEGQSESYCLCDPEKPVFERGGVDVFLLSMPFSLGELQSIEISHDNSGGSPDWYLDKVMLQDLQTQNVSHFLCSTWLRGEMCKRTFNCAKKNEIASFGDEHIWVSVVDPPRRSPFTRVQRVSCCMSLLLCTMAINIMFWNLPTDAESPVILKIGSFQLTWQEFMVAIESGLFMFPINILIITIFRHIKPRIVSNKDDLNNSKKSTAAVTVSMNTIMQETIGLLNHLSKSPKNMLTSKEIQPETSGDLFWALNKVNGVLQIVEVESVGDPHWLYCGRFILYSLSHISNLLEHVGEKGCFLNEELREARGTVLALLNKAENATKRHTSQSPPFVQIQKKKQGWWLPWWFVFIGWLLLFAMSGFSTFFTLLYGFQYGKESSIQWVITLTLSLVQSIFILQPLKVRTP